MATLPSGTIISVATAFAAAKTVSDISNAAEAVVSCTAHGYSVDDIVQIYSGWGRLNRRAVRVKSVLTDSFVAESIDTTNTEFFPAGSGGGTVRKVTTFTQIPKYLNPSQSGGDPKNVTVRFMDEDTDLNLNDGFNAVIESFEIDSDQFGSASYTAMRTLTDVQSDTVLKKTLKSGAMIFTPCTLALNENPKMSNGAILTNVVSINGNGRITRYAA
ncbi:phage tail protein [Aromatoleum toluolicum]|uniref:Phage tail protein n=1 Tax=Aromatoleum toluolicum TaxID=90060 RepID=A0ABX1NGG5_9RHOO|nr:phage tail tube protein [Aromatoleum toluolicum]NMF98387.1 phage tail protein [Aromatoleum toluolicum]